LPSLAWLFRIHWPGVEDSIQQQNLQRFIQVVQADQGLLDQLRATPNEGAFLELAVRLAARHGYDVTPETLQTAIRAKRQAWLGRWI